MMARSRRSGQPPRRCPVHPSADERVSFAAAARARNGRGWTRAQRGALAMKLLAVHPSGLMFTRVFLRLEPLGLELVAAAARRAGHEVRILDLQAHSQASYFRIVDSCRPDAICFSGNYLANIPEIIDLAKAAKARLPHCFIFAGGHSISFTAEEILEHGEGAIDCVLKCEGAASVAALLH